MKQNLREMKDRVFDILYLISGSEYFLTKNISKLYYKKIKNRFFTSPYFVARLDSAQLSFAQEGEDLVLKRILGNKFDMGFYVDVGAHHPSRFSNTYAFYLNGWSGINIEPNPDLIPLFDKERPRDTNLNLGIGAVDRPMAYYMFNDGALNTFSPERAEEVSCEGIYHLKETRLIQIKPLAKILYGCNVKEKQITFMNVDCEGFDYQVLASNDWEKYRPLYVLVECLFHSNLSNDISSKEDVCDFMASVGYARAAKTYNTTFWLDTKK